MTVLKDSASGAKSDNCDDPLLRVRLAPPDVPHRFLDRARLTAALDRASGVPLTLVSGPAGSGKTALTAAWVASRDDATEWMSFDEGEVPPEQLWSDLLECLRRHGADVTARRPGNAGAHRHSVMQVAVAVASLTEPVTVVMDGCELVSPDLASDLDFVLRHSAALLHVVILTRVDPALPLHRYRLDDTLGEVRTADLAFTVEETARLVELYVVELSRDSIRALHRRTGGWAAALRFAMMVLERSDDPDAAVQQLAGDRGNIAEYLMAEVLLTQSEDVQTLLMATSVVEVLRPGLIEELVGASGAHSLDALARANVLVEVVADRPGWYRYHPLLRDLLRSELAYRAPGERRRLHLVAAQWYVRENELGRAVELVAEVGAWDQAARFVVDELAAGRLVLGRTSDDVAWTMGDMPREIDDPGAAVVRAALALADDEPAVYARELSRARALTDMEGPADHRSVQVSIELLEAQATTRLHRVRQAAAPPRHPVVPAQRRAPVGIATDTPPPGQVIEPLTAKEHEVLGHLSDLLSTEEIAGAMYVSVNTVRTHVRSILRKLAVSRRNEAVRRARALGLITS